jgi:6,7-dimethyl-8-ribityllumazine synthase
MTGCPASFPRWDLRPAKGGMKKTVAGAAFLAPLGNLEFVDGQFPSTADVLVEVTALDAVHQAAAAWLLAQGPQVESGPEAHARLSAITETHWKSRLFTVEPEPGFAFSFWAWTDPQRASRWPSKAISPPTA